MSTREPRTAPAALPLLAPLVAIVFLGFLAIGVPLPVLPEEVHGTLGYGTVMVGWVVGLQSLATVATRQLAGTTCDRRGPKAAVLLGLPAAALAGGCYLAAAAIPAAPELRLAILLAGRLLLGCAESLFLTGTMAWGIGRLGAGRAGVVMAWQGIAIYAALGLGAPIGLAVQAAAGFAGVALLTMALPLLALGIAAALPAIAALPGRRLPFYRVIGQIWAPGLCLALATVPFGGLAAFVALDYAAHGWPGAGLAMTGFAGGFILVRLLGAGLADRVGAGPVAAGSLLAELAGQGLMWAAADPLQALAGATLTGLGYSLVFPAMGVAALRGIAPQNRGLALGGYVAFFDIALGVAGPATGALAAHAGYPSVFLAGAGSAAAALLLALVSVARRSD